MYFQFVILNLRFMLHNLKSLIGCNIHAIDGEIGKVDDFYFDDRSGSIRYLIVDTTNWIEGAKVLLSPVVIQQPDVLNRYITVKLTQNQIRNSPDIDTKKPVSRQNVIEFPDYYQWPIYGMSVLSAPMLNDQMAPQADSLKGNDDPHLRSAEDVEGYNISALDGEIGHVDDMIIDDETWMIHYWVVKTKNWLPGKKVLISPQWINLISWEDKKVFVDMTVDSIKKSPGYDPSKPLQMEYETELNNYYGRSRTIS